MTKSINKILIANRGEIACRIIDTARDLDIETVAVYSDVDGDARHVIMADEAYCIGPAPVAESYLCADKIIAVAIEAGADAIHPGYGFLSENADFAEACQKEGLIFIGPSADNIRAMGLKGAAKALMIDAGVPVVPGYHGSEQSTKKLKSEADKIGYPLLIKAVAGGGGKGMRLVEKPDDFAEALNGAKREGKNSFGNDVVLLEKYITTPRHIEIQVFGDEHGNAVHLYERDCSLQRRHQKVVEEAPAPNMPTSVRKAMGDAAIKAAKAIGYKGAGTIEFIVDAAGKLSENSFYFMEMNTRLQVEHPVSEAITGEDLVAWQILVAEGKPLPKTQDELSIDGHAIEVRLYAEDPDSGFLPQTGVVNYFDVPEGDNVRLETGIVEGDEVSQFYDPMIAKIITWGETRDQAIETMQAVLENTCLAGVKTNLAFLNRTISHKAFKAGKVETGFIEKHGIDLFAAPLERSDLHTPVAMAVLAHMAERGEEENENDPYSPWADNSGWRMGLAYEETLYIDHDGGEKFSVRFIKQDESSLTIDGKFYFISDVDMEHNYLEATLNEEEYESQVWQDGNHVAVMSGAEVFNFTLHIGTEDDDEASAAPGAVLSPMPGKIIESFYKNGDEVEADAPLLILEAMKMEYTLKAPRSGVVEGLSVKVGEQVNDGAILLNIAHASS